MLTAISSGAVDAVAPEPAADGGRQIPLSPTDCPLCGDEAAEPQAIARDFRRPPSAEALLALRCNGCGCVYLSPAPSPGDRNRLLAVEDLRGTEWELAAGLAGRSRRRRAVLRLGANGQSHPADRTLEVRARGDAAVEEVARTGQQYDRIILNEVVEYLSDPVTQLQSLRRALRPDGRLVVVLHNVASPSFALFGGRHWAGYDFPRQRAVYPLPALERIAQRAGLAVDRATTIPDAACWLESARRLLSDWRSPRWLTRGFESLSGLAGAFFGLVERVLQWRGRGASLVVALRPVSSGADTRSGT